MNTLDERFGILHQEQHRYLDEVLLNFEIISDCRIPTRGDNTLDVALANREAKRGNIRSQVMRKLNSDHNPTKTKIDLECNPYQETEVQDRNRKRNTHAVIDIQKTK